MDTTAPPAPPPRTGISIDQGPRPAWVADHLSVAQLGLDSGLQWITLLEKARGLGTSAKLIAHTLYRSTIGSKLKKSMLTVRTLCERADIGSQTTVVSALARLVRDGWVRREVRDLSSRRLARERPGQAGVGYRLAWPERDCLAPADGPLRCAQPTSKGGLCTVRAGKGTLHPGTGACWRHGGQRANQPAQTAPEPSSASSPPSADRPVGQAEEHSATSRTLQLVEHSRRVAPVDNGHVQHPLLTSVDPGMLQPLQPNAPTVTDGMLQRLQPNAPAVGAEDDMKTTYEVDHEETRGSRALGAELEGAPAAPRTTDGRFESETAEAAEQQSDGTDSGLTLERARQELADLSAPRREWVLSRARMDLARRRRDITDDAVLIAAAVLARRRTA